jgi:hypothetical protein
MAKGAKTLSAVPLLSSLVSPLSWAMAASARVAASFGYSKPIDTRLPTRAFVRNQDWTSYYNAPDMSLPLSSSIVNEVQRVPYFPGTKVDEMSFDYILTRPSLISNPKFSTGDTVEGTVKYTCRVSPSSMYYLTVNNTVPYTRAVNGTGKTAKIAPAPVLYMGNTFGLWRGGFRFTFVLPKTKFHRGRLLVSYQPPGYTNPLTNFDPTKVLKWDKTRLSGHNVIWDIENADTVSIDVPFFAPQRYLPINSDIGYVTVSVLDGLRVVADASTTLEMAVFVECLPGFEFANLTKPFKPPAPPALPGDLPFCTYAV